MTRSRNASSKAKTLLPQGSAARLLVTALVFLAFSLQSYVTQTHIHLAPNSLASGSNAGTSKQQPDKFPPADDPANCPICQEILHTGQYLTPAAAALALPSQSVSVIALVVDAVAVVSTASHTWRSRAPPAA